MPLFTNIEPVYVSREVGDNLEQNAAGTLSSIILQLSNLSLRGGQLIEGLLEEISSLNKRYNNIKNRIDSMNVEIDSLDAKAEQDSQTSIVICNKRRKSSQYKPVFVRNSLPKSLRDQYERCEPPPPFKMIFGDIPFAQDGCVTEERIRFYSNIHYFKDSWCEQKKQMKIKKRIIRNKLLKLQTTEISEVFQKDEKYYPVPIHQLKPRISETREKSQTLLKASPIQEQFFMSHSGTHIEPDYSNQNQYEYPSFDTNSYPGSEPDVASEYSREYNDDSSIMYEVFAPADTVSIVSPELDRVSASNTEKFSWQCNQNRVMESVPTYPSHRNSTEENTKPQISETLVQRKILPLKQRSEVSRRQSAVKDLLKSFVLERRRFIKLESTSCSSDYSEESSTECEDSQSDDGD